jgi:UDP:flavonoid glycosyltransferase YjiC (YdhE family)
LQIANYIKNDFEILFISATKYNQLVLDNGFKLIEQKDEAVEEILLQAQNFNFSWINEKDMNQLILSAKNIILNYKPIAVISDAMLSMRVTCELAGVKHITLINNYVSNYYADIRPLPVSHPAFEYQQKVPKAVWEKILHYAEKVSMRYVHKTFKKLRKTYNLPATHSLLDEFEGGLNLLCDNEILFPLKNKPKNFIDCGPLYFMDDEQNSSAFAWLQKRPNRKAILISTGSSGSDSMLYFINHDYFKQFNILISGKYIQENNEHIFYQEFIHIKPIIDKIDLMITHGGNGTIYQALHGCIPHIIIPAIFEQEWNAYRIEKLNLGLIHYPIQGITDLIVKVTKSLEAGKTSNLMYYSKLISVKNNQKEIVKRAVLSFIKK